MEENGINADSAGTVQKSQQAMNTRGDGEGWRGG